MTVLQFVALWSIRCPLESSPVLETCWRRSTSAGDVRLPYRTQLFRMKAFRKARQSVEGGVRSLSPLQAAASRVLGGHSKGGAPIGGPPRAGRSTDKATTGGARPDRCPGLDGLRGIALLLVLGYHLNILGCGWVGVQLFFVLSGFLITRILIEARSEHPPATALGRFYVRRGLRIFPVFYLYLAVMIAGLVLLQPA